MVSDAAVGWSVILALVAVGSLVTGLWWRHQTKDDPEEFYRRLDEKQRRSAEGGPPGI